MTETTRAQPSGDLAWWVDRLRHRLAEAGPPLFRRRSRVYRRRSKSVNLPLPQDLSQKLVGTGSDRVHALFLAALTTVLYRYQGTSETETIVVGSPVTGPGRSSAQVLPLIADVAADTSFGRLVEKVSDEITEAAQRASCSLSDLLEGLRLDEVTDRHPLFPVVLLVAGLHRSIPELRNDVTLTVSESSVELEFNANVHSEDTIARFGRHIVTCLNHGLADPDLQIRSVNYVPEDESAELARWGDGGGAKPDDLCLHHLFEAAVQAHPNREALVFGEDVISYAELNARANRLAHHLLSRGAGPGTRVGLCLPPSPELLVGVLGVLKTGAVVVPIVPTFPASRNAMTVEDSKIQLVVTDSFLGERHAGTGVGLVLVDAHAREIARMSTTDPVTAVTAADPVYAMFTSGSTGRPKGTVLEHRTLVNLVQWQRDRGPDPSGKRTLQRTSIGFDVSFQEIFSTLGFGGSLVVATDEVRDDVSLLPGYVERYGISRLFLPPVALDQLAVTAGLEQSALPTLKEVIVAGEQLRITMPIRRLFHQVDCALDNQYGPTETHVVTGFTLDGPSTRWAETPPIGTPIRGVRVRLLDPWMRPVPVGVPGEIHVAGIGPAEGYLTEDTAERFVPAPSGEPGDRLYRTGDRARLLPDGHIEFLGRDDDQVKIRGYRIELGEIEAHLTRVPGVRQATVTVHDAETVGRQLTAHVVTDSPEVPDSAEIRRHLLENLPGHMVPTTPNIVRTDALPLTPTGKVDRRKLSPPPRPHTTGAGSALADGDTEETVAKIWAQALGLGGVGRDADFIDLGGHSLVGIQIVAQLNELYSVSLPLRSLLRGTTVARLASEIEAARAGQTEQDQPSPGPRLQEVELADGRRLMCLQPSETAYLHLDVFAHRTYDRAGIVYPDTGVVLDVGAHIGLFTLYALSCSPGLRVLAFEPCPPLFDALRHNTGHLAGVEQYPFGLGEKADTADLTFYSNLTGMSSFHPDDGEERALLSGILENLGRLNASVASSALSGSQEYLDERLLSSAFTCERRTLSQVLAETGVERVALLKIDVQKAELDVLNGIAPQDWPRIDQIVVEVHDLEDRVERVRSLLSSRGYHVQVEQDPLHTGTVVHFVYAVQP